MTIYNGKVSSMLVKGKIEHDYEGGIPSEASKKLRKIASEHEELMMDSQITKLETKVMIEI